MTRGFTRFGFASGYRIYFLIRKISQAKSAKLLQEWLAHAISTDNTHLVANFGQQTSSALIYNLVVDRWLNLNAIPMSVSVL